MSGVWIGPGHSALTRTPVRAYSTAISRVIDSTPPLLAVYAIWATAEPMSATSEATLITDPPPDAMSAGMPCRQHNHTPSG